jgi:hypothetical protein
MAYHPEEKAERFAGRSARIVLLDFPATLLPVPLPGKSLLHTQLLTRLQIERMTLYFFNNVFLLHLPLKAAKGVLQRFTILESDFSQRTTPPNPP